MTTIPGCGRTSEPLTSYDVPRSTPINEPRPNTPGCGKTFPVDPTTKRPFLCKRCAKILGQLW